jgi:CTP:molybdopterin cytidylyltransferase MocA
VIAGVVLAAGGSTRFGSPKQLAELRGRPLLDRVVDTVRAVPAVDPILVVLGAHAERIRAALDLEDVEVVVADGWEEGISASLRAGVAAAGKADAIVVVLGDQPLISPQVIASVVQRLDGAAPAARATFDGAPGHPVLIKRSLFAELGDLRGDSGARELLEAHGVTTVECGHLASGHDVDTPADLKAIGTERTELEVSG